MFPETTEKFLNKDTECEKWEPEPKYFFEKFLEKLSHTDHSIWLDTLIHAAEAHDNTWDQSHTPHLSFPRQSASPFLQQQP